MGFLADVKRYITQDEIKYKSAISENTFAKMGSMINHLGHRSHEKKDAKINGRYKVFNLQTGIDGLDFFEFNAEIFNVYMYNLVPGLSGTTELDLKIATVSGGAFTSIFSTTPKINASAGINVWTYIGSQPTGCIAPVLTAGAANIAAHTAMRIDMIQSQTGSPENCGLIVHYRNI
jgi:hypothetical protein